LGFHLLDVPLNRARMAAWWVREAYLNRTGRVLPAYRLIPEPETAPAGT
jgi:hypothetical protein